MRTTAERTGAWEWIGADIRDRLVPKHGRRHTAGSGAPPCPVRQINLRHPSLTLVGNVPAALTSACTLRDVAVDASGKLYIAEATIGVIYRLTPNAAAPPDATGFAPACPGQTGSPLT